MSFTVEVLGEKKNPLIKRTEIKFRVEHFGAGTPNRIDVKNKLAALVNSKENLTIIKNLQTYFGASYAIGRANAYEDAEELKYYEPFHIQVRNLPKEQRLEIQTLKKKKEAYKHLFNYE